MANRLSKVLEKLMLKPQNVDSVFIANKCLDSKFKLEELVLFCNLDLEKIYDHVNWSFLFYMLERCDFDTK